MTYLDNIIAHHRRRVAGDPRSRHDLDEILAVTPRRDTRSLRAAISQANHLAVIAEIKRRSPSKGSLAAHLDPPDIAYRYESGGAVALSVLTDEPHFGGCAQDLIDARRAVSLPVLRKDFTVSPLDLVDAVAMGADAVLLIVAALTVEELARLHRLASALGLDALVEVHDEAELDIALELGVSLIGVNQRDLQTFEVDHARAARLAGRIPNSVVAVAESGIRDAADARRCMDAGFAAILVGEHLVTSGAPEQAVRDLCLALPS